MSVQHWIIHTWFCTCRACSGMRDTDSKKANTCLYNASYGQYKGQNTGSVREWAEDLGSSLRENIDVQAAGAAHGKTLIAAGAAHVKTLIGTFEKLRRSPWGWNAVLAAGSAGRWLWKGKPRPDRAGACCSGAEPGFYLDTLGRHWRFFSLFLLILVNHIFTI